MQTVLSSVVVPTTWRSSRRKVFSNKWIRNWMRDYNVSLPKPNKRFQMKQSDREERIYEYLKNMWTFRKFFIDDYNVDPPIFIGGQMPLHRNESLGQTLKGLDTFVKENHVLSRERATAYTQICSDPNVTLQPEFVFKGKGTHTKLNPPEGDHFQWAPEGSYREDDMIKTISHLTNWYNIFTPKNYAIYVLDN